MLDRGSSSRREFLGAAGKTSLAIGAGIALPNIFLNCTRAVSGVNPSEFIRLGFIGVGGQGNSNLGALLKHAVAVCDVDKAHLAAAKARVEQANQSHCAAYSDYRKLLEDKSIDAVLISTPDHWHTLTAAHACEAGKDVYCEKPLTLTIAEGQTLLEVARRTKRIVQTGSQQRSDPKFRRACELIRSGYMGRVQAITVGLPGPNYMDRAKPPSVPDSEPPRELDYEFWLGPAPWRPYNKNRVHYLFRFYWDYSGGQMTNWGAHHLDIVQWALGMDNSGPVSAEGSAVHNKDKLFETPQSFQAVYRYADGITVTVNSPGKPSGVRFECQKGVLTVGRGKLDTEPEDLLANAPMELAVKLYVSSEHHQNWLDCIKSRRLPICDVAIGHRSATVCHLGNIAVRTGKKVVWDPAKEEIVGDTELAKWVGRPYRAPWKLPSA